jgi:predicted permease
MPALGREVRFALRLLRRDRAFTLAAVATLAIGIGLNAAVFSVVDAVLFRPLPVAEPERLVRVFSATPEDPVSHSPLTWTEVTELRRRASGLEAVAAFTYTSLVVEAGEAGRLVLGELVTDDYFATLGVVPALGRFFDPDRPAGTAPAPPVAVLSHSAWSRRFGADPGVIGRPVRVNGAPFTVIGVAPVEFFGMTRGVVPELWIPLGARRAWERPGAAIEPPPAEDRDRGGEEPAFLWVVARLADGVPVAAARAEIAAVGVPETATPADSRRTLLTEPASRVRILPGIDRGIAAGSWLLLGVVALVLLVACSNVANLCLARALGRRGEIATRMALGAGTGAIVRQLLVEGALLALAGGGLGLLLAGATARALAAVRLPIPLDLAVGARVDARVLAFTVAIAALTAVAFSLAPALAAARTDLVREMREGAAALTRRRRRLSRGSVVVQIAVSLVLLVAGGLSLRSLWRARDLDLGYRPEGAVVATFAPHLQGYGPERTDRFYRDLLARVRALPGVVAAGLTSHLPMSFELRFDTVEAAGAGGGEGDSMHVDSALAGPGHFAAMGIPVLRGRDFEDDPGTPLAPGTGPGRARVVVVNDALAARLWPEGEAVGRHLWIAGLEGGHEVVGVVATGKARTLGEAPRPFLYRPFGTAGGGGEGALQVSSGTVTLVARVEGEAAAALAAVRGAAREADPDVAVSRLTTLEAALAPALLLPRAAAALFGAFGALGLILAAIGTYALMAHATAQRRHEVGVRLAFGARRPDVERLLVREGLAVALAGVGCGLILAGLLRRFLEPILFGVDSADGIAWGAAAAVVLGAAAAASYLPARRLARIEPGSALRCN